MGEDALTLEDYRKERWVNGKVYGIGKMVMEKLENVEGQQQPMRTIFNVEKKQETNMEKWMADYCENVNLDLAYTSKASIVKEFDSHKNMDSMAVRPIGGDLFFFSWRFTVMPVVL